MRERASPKEPKSEVLARSKQYFDGSFQFYEMWMHGWISLVHATASASDRNLLALN